MNRVKIKIALLGSLPFEFRIRRVSGWRSKLFEIVDRPEHYELRSDSDAGEWSYSDECLAGHLPSSHNADFLLAITNVPIEDNWYSRRLSNNIVIVTLHEIKDILEHYNIPIENIILRLLYSYALLYKQAGGRIPACREDFPSFTHDETRGCIYDMNGIKTDVAASCHKPILCDQCRERLKSNRVSLQEVNATDSELKKIKKETYYRVLDFVKRRPLASLLISSAFAIALNIVASCLHEAVTSGSATEVKSSSATKQSETLR